MHSSKIDFIKFRLAIDPIFYPSEQSPTSKRIPPWDILPENKFVLVFDEKVDAQNLSDYFMHREANTEIGKIMEVEEANSSESDTEQKPES